MAFLISTSVDLSGSIDDVAFVKMLHRSIAIRKQANSGGGAKDNQYEYSRRLYRAHNALVLPAQDWDN